MKALEKKLKREYRIQEKVHIKKQLPVVDEDCSVCQGLGFLTLFCGWLEEMVCEVIPCPKCQERSRQEGEQA